jgi:hypothetical protein
MSIISALREYLAEYESLKTGSPVLINYLDTMPTGYTIIPLSGERIIETYLDDSTLREFPFAFQSMESTSADLERLENIGFFEAFSDWLEQQTLAEDFPDLDDDKAPIEIAALGWGYLYQQGESQTGIYQIQCKLTYQQEPITVESE